MSKEEFVAGSPFAGGVVEEMEMVAKELSLIYTSIVKE